MRLLKAGKLTVFCLIATVLLTAGGLGYAQAANTVDVTGLVEACTPTPPPTPPPPGGPVPVIWVVSNDNAATTNIGGYNPIDLGDAGLDPKPGSFPFTPYSPPSPNQPGQTTSRSDKNVAVTTASVASDGNSFSATLTNAYPYYYPTVFFGITNTQSTTATVDSIQITFNGSPVIMGSGTNKASSNELTAYLQGINVGDTIAANALEIGWLGIQVEQNARQNTVYKVQVVIILSGEEPTSTPPEQDGTIGYWMNWPNHYTRNQMLGFLDKVGDACFNSSRVTGSNWLRGVNTINEMQTVFDNKNGTAKQKFMAHYLAMRLSQVAGLKSLTYKHDVRAYDPTNKLGLSQPSAATLADIIRKIENKYSSTTNANYDIMKNICDAINNLII